MQQCNSRTTEQFGLCELSSAMKWVWRSTVFATVSTASKTMIKVGA